jgi:hypothetical protein
VRFEGMEHQEKIKAAHMGSLYQLSDFSVSIRLSLAGLLASIAQLRLT